MAVSLLLNRHATIITGVEDDPGGVGIRVYVGPRSERAYYLVSVPELREEIRRQWRTPRHLVVDLRELAEFGLLLREPDA